METQADPRASVYVARQPILTAAGGVYGYELLYRSGAAATSCTTPGDLAAARVFSDALLTLGLDTLTGGRRAFINITRQVLLADFATLLPRDGVVLELLESIDVDAEVIEACKQLRERGYLLALDDYVVGSSADALLPFVNIVKVDMLTTKPEQHGRLVAAMPKKVKLVAEKVESIDVFSFAQKLGYQLFQGYYFSRPMTFQGRSMAGRRVAYVRLLAALNNPDATVLQLEELIKQDGSLSYRVLRCVNSAAFGIRRQLHSIRQALVMLGLDSVRKWASVWALAGVSDGAADELVNLAIIRARSCERIAEALYGPDGASEYFLLGLCSLLDSMLGRPMAEAIEDLPVPDDIRAALLGEANLPHSVLAAVLEYERGEWDSAIATLEKVGIEPHHLPIAYGDALKWARELTRTAAAA